MTEVPILSHWNYFIKLLYHWQCWQTWLFLSHFRVLWGNLLHSAQTGHIRRKATAETADLWVLAVSWRPKRTGEREADGRKTASSVIIIIICLKNNGFIVHVIFLPTSLFGKGFHESQLYVFPHNIECNTTKWGSFLRQWGSGGPGRTKGRNKVLFPFATCMGKTAHPQKTSLIVCGYSNLSTRTLTLSYQKTAIYHCILGVWMQVITIICT